MHTHMCGKTRVDQRCSGLIRRLELCMWQCFSFVCDRMYGRLTSGSASASGSMSSASAASFADVNICEVSFGAAY